MADVARGTQSGVSGGAASALEALRWGGNLVGTGLAAALLGVLDDPRAVLTASCACPLAVCVAACFVRDSDLSDAAPRFVSLDDDSAPLLLPQQSSTTPLPPPPPPPPPTITTTTTTTTIKRIAKAVWRPAVVVAARSLVPSHRTSFASFAYTAFALPSYQYTVASAAGNLGSCVGAVLFYRVLRSLPVRRTYVALTVLAAVAPLARIWLFVGRVDAAASDPLGTLVLLSAWNFAEDAVWSAALVPGLALAAQSAAKGWEAFSFAAVATATAWATTAQGYASASIARGLGVEAGPGGTWDSAGTGALAALIALCCALHAVLLPPLAVLLRE